MEINFKNRIAKRRGTSGRTVICYILDESSSMHSKIDSVISGLNEYIQTLKQDETNDDILFCLTKFNTQAEVVYAVEPLKNVGKFTSDHYKPNGMTALLDAVGMTIQAVDDVIDEGDRVLFAIMTDGEENSSKEFNTTAIADLIKSRTKDGWEFVFFGADQNAWNTAGSWGISRGNTMVYTNDSYGTRSAMHTHAHATSNYLAGNARPGMYLNFETDGTADTSNLSTSGTSNHTHTMTSDAIIDAGKTNKPTAKKRSRSKKVTTGS